MKPVTDLEEQLLTLAEAAQLLRCSTRTIRRYIDRGDLEARGERKSLRVTRVSVKNWRKVA